MSIRYPRLAGHRGIQTSIKAADGVDRRDKLGKMGRIVSEFLHHGPLSVEEVSEFLPYHARYTPPRITELKATGLLEVCGETVNRSSGQVADRYRLDPEAEAILVECREHAEDDGDMLTSLNFRVDAQSHLYMDEPAQLGSSWTGYSVARSQLGVFLVKLHAIDPYMQGFRLRLWVTPLVPVDLDGLDVTVSWFENEQKKTEDWSREVKLSSPFKFQPGRWTEVEIPITPASPAGLIKFWVSLKPSTVTIAIPSASSSRK
jgi:hypothetical protein